MLESNLSDEENSVLNKFTFKNEVIWIISELIRKKQCENIISQ